MVQKVLTAFVSSVLLITFMLYPIIKQVTTVHFYIYIYVLVGYLILGIPTSYLIDSANNKLETPNKFIIYLYNVCLYGIGGIIAFYLYIVILEKSFIVNIDVILRGIIPSLIFYHVSIFFKSINK